jgi:hypothetical protein
MAQDLQSGRYARQLRRMFDLKGLDSLAINDHLSAMLISDNLDKLIYRNLKDVRTFGGSASLGAVAGQQAVISLAYDSTRYTPPVPPYPGPGAQLELQALWISNPAAAIISVNLGTETTVIPAMALSVQGSPLDKRPPRAISQAALFAGNTAAPPALTGPLRLSLQAGQAIILAEDQLSYIIPGDGTIAGGCFPICVLNNSANSPLICTFIWRERLVEQSEQQS